MVEFQMFIRSDLLFRLKMMSVVVATERREESRRRTVGETPKQLDNSKRPVAAAAAVASARQITQTSLSAGFNLSRGKLCKLCAICVVLFLYGI